MLNYCHNVVLPQQSRNGGNGVLVFFLVLLAFANCNRMLYAYNQQFNLLWKYHSANGFYHKDWEVGYVISIVW